MDPNEPAPEPSPLIGPAHERGSIPRVAILVALVLAIGSVGVWLVVAGPGPPVEDEARRTALVAQVRSAALRDEIDLLDSLGSGWDRLAIFQPYSNNVDARNVLGFDFDIERVSPWTNTEGGVVFVLVDVGTLVGWFTLPSDAIGIRCLEGAFPASEARFFVVPDGDGFRQLASPAQASCSQLFSPYVTVP